MKNRTTAAILAFFLGGLGIHRFYLGQNMLGFLYLLFCWTLLPSLIGFIDFIVFLVMSDSNFNAKYNPGVNENIIRTNIPTVKNIAADELEKLYNLKEKGILTEQEFQERKARLLS